MADFSGSVQVAAAPRHVFDQLSDVSALPRYFARMTSATPGDGEEVRTTARMPDGTEVQGDAWFRVSDADLTLEWGSEGPSDYHGRLQVSSAGEGSQVQVSLHTTRVQDDDREVQDGIDETLASIRTFVEPG